MRDSTKRALEVIGKAYGVDAATILSEVRDAASTAIPTSNLAFDRGLLGIGGLPRGKFVELYGRDKVGKTSLMGLMIAGCQNAGVVPIVLDPNLSIADDPERAVRMGIVPEDLILLPISTSEESLLRVRAAIEGTTEDGIALAVFWDDMGLSPSRSNLDRAKEEKDTKAVAEKARVMWEFCRSLLGLCYRRGVLLVIVNHLIANIGSFGFSNTSTTTGGGGVRAASRIRIKMSRLKIEKKGASKVGQIVRMTTEANAFFRPFLTVDMYLDFVNGYDSTRSVLINAEAAGVVTKDRGKYGFKGKRKLAPEEWSPSDLELAAAKTWPWSSSSGGVVIEEDGDEEDGFGDDPEASEDAFVEEFEAEWG